MPSPVNEPNAVADPRSPVRDEQPSAAAEALKPGPALCLSGGGYRAMVFHAGVLWRLNEGGYLPRLDRISSVRLVNWGYAVCDAAMRRHVDPDLAQPAGFPYAGRGV